MRQNYDLDRLYTYQKNPLKRPEVKGNPLPVIRSVNKEFTAIRLKVILPKLWK